MKAAIGIDIGGTSVQVGLVDEKGKYLRKSQLMVASVPLADDFLNRLKQVIEELVVESSCTELIGIGVGTPGANVKSGMIEKASNLPWDRLPIVHFLGEEFQVPVHLTNDANLFAIGEKIFGAAKTCNDFIVVTLGTGVGAGIYCNGELLQGRDGLAGEFGHVVVAMDGRPCQCGRKGCLERYVSATGVALTAIELIRARKSKSALYGLQEKKISSRRVAEAAHAGDALGIETFQYTGEILGKGLADLVTLFNPEVIFLAGGLAKSGVLLLQPTIRSFQEKLLNIYPMETPIRETSLSPDQAGVLGAAALVWESNGKFKNESVI